MKEVAWPKFQNEEMNLKNLSFPEDEVGIPEREHPCAKKHCNPVEQQEKAKS